MKIVVIGGTGRIGRRLVKLLRRRGSETIAAAPSMGVDTISGKGLAEVLADARVVVDVTNAPAGSDEAVLHFFETSTRHILAEEMEAGVRHHVLLSVVGAKRLPGSGYMRAKVAQENLVKNGGVPFTILCATQFFEFLETLANIYTEGNLVSLPAARVQPVAAGDVAAALAEAALGKPVNGTIRLAGPEQFQLDAMVSAVLRTQQDPRQVATDKKARYFGAELEADALLPVGDAKTAPTRFADWLDAQRIEADSS
ncbi:MAG: SDR family oxidoreductase [Anaerolineales bacterium]